MSVFEDQRLKLTDFAVVHDGPSTGAGPSVALFRKLKDGESSDGESSDKVLSWRAAIKRVESHGSCSVSFYVRFLFL